MLYANGNPVGGGGGGTGGHTIIDENGTSMPARAGLQFVGGANVSDDATNNKTIVDMSGGGVYIEKTLWEDANGLQFAPNNIQTITLSESLNKYDFIYVDVSSVEDSGYHNQNILAVSSLYDENDGYNGTVCIGGNINHTNSFAKVDNTHLKFIGFSSANPLIVWKVVGIKVSGDYYAPVIYSTEEREIGVWTDGKPLYEKTVYIASLPSTTTQTNYAHNINNIDKIIDYDGTIQFNNATKTTAKFDRIGTSTNTLDFGNTLAMTVTNENIAIIVGKDRSACSAYVTVRYTKTTDVAGSGSWTPQGVPTHHYSTDEHIIGTWLGKTLYEKTVYNTSSLNYGQINNISTGILGADEVLLMTGSASYRNNNSYLPLPYMEASTNEVIKVGEFNKVNGNVQIFVGNAYQSPYLINKIILTIRYTKSS